MTLVLNGTTGVSAVDGSASTPAIQGNDTNTGVFFPAADTVAMATGGSEHMRVDSSGNLLVGVTSSFGKLTINSNGAPASSGSMSTGLTVANGTGGTAINIGTNDLGSYNYIQSAYVNSANTTRTLSFFIGATERARINTDGNLLVNTTSYQNGVATSTFWRGDSTPALNVVSVANANVAALRIERYQSDGDGVTFFYGSTQKGYITVASTGTSYNTLSDYRLKEDVAPMTGALAKVAALKPVTYRWKDTGIASQGFIAHELQAVVPECVTGQKDELQEDGSPRYQGVDTSFLVATLTAAIQELNAKVESLTAEIATLKGAQA